MPGLVCLKVAFVFYYTLLVLSQLATLGHACQFHFEFLTSLPAWHRWARQKRCVQQLLNRITTSPQMLRIASLFAQLKNAGFSLLQSRFVFYHTLLVLNFGNAGPRRAISFWIFNFTSGVATLGHAFGIILLFFFQRGNAGPCLLSINMLCKTKKKLVIEPWKRNKMLKSKLHFSVE